MRTSRLVAATLAAAACSFASAQPCQNPPAAPLQAVFHPYARSTCSVQLDYTPLPDATAYEMWSADTTDFSQAVFVGNGYANRFYDARPTANNTGSQFVRYYWVRGVNPCGPGPFAGPIQGSLHPGRPFPPQDQMVFSACNTAFVDVGYTNVWGEYYSKIWRSPTPSFADAVAIADWERYRWKFADSSVEPGRTYWYWTMGSNGCCSSSISEPVSTIIVAGADFATQGYEAMEGESAILSVQIPFAPDAWTFQWYRDGVPLTESGRFHGTTYAILDVYNTIASDAGDYVVVINPGCDSFELAPARLFVHPPCPTSAADYNADGGIDGEDILAFFTDWERAHGCADVDSNGGVDGADVEYFFVRWEDGR